MAQFERLIIPSEQEAASRLKSYIADVQDSPQQVVKLFHFSSGCVCMWVFLSLILVIFTLQLLQFFQKQKELIKRPTISKELKPEREILLARLQDHNKGSKQMHFQNFITVVAGYTCY